MFREPARSVIVGFSVDQQLVVSCMAICRIVDELCCGGPYEVRQRKGKATVPSGIQIAKCKMRNANCKRRHTKMRIENCGKLGNSEKQGIVAMKSFSNKKSSCWANLQ